MGSTEETERSIADKETAMDVARNQGVRIFTISLNTNKKSNINELSEVDAETKLNNIFDDGSTKACEDILTTFTNGMSQLEDKMYSTPNDNAIEPELENNRTDNAVRDNQGYFSRLFGKKRI